MSDESRAALLKSLIDGRISPSEAEKELSRYPFDSDPLVMIKSADVVTLLEKLLAGRVTSHYMEEWANVVEVRDDLSFDPACEDQMAQVVHELANPLLTGPLDEQAARKMLSILQSC